KLLPRRRDILGERHAESWMRVGAAEQREPENRRRVIEERSQVGKDDARWEEQVPLRIVNDVVKIRADFYLVVSVDKTEAVRKLRASLLVEIGIGSALSGNQQVRNFQVRLLEHGEEIEAAAGPLESGFIHNCATECSQLA